MKEATGEVSGTVITIVLVAAVLAIGAYLFTAKDENGRTIAGGWIEDIFKDKLEIDE